MSEDSAAVAYGDETTTDPGPVVELDTTGDWAASEPPEGGWNAEDATWVLDIGKGLESNPELVRLEVQREWETFKEKVVANHFDDEMLLAGVEKVYSTSRAAEFFGRSTQWMYWGLRIDVRTNEPPFTYKDGTPILPERVGTMGKRRFTLPIIKEIALCCYRRGNLKEEELEEIMARILLAEFGARAFANVEGAS